MYRVLCDGLPIQDLRDESLVLIDPQADLEVGKAGSFKFKIPPTHPRFDSIKRMKSCIEVWHDEELIFEGRPLSDDSDFYNRKNVVCEGALGYLNDTVQRPCRYTAVTVRGYLEAVIGIHNEQVDENRRFEVGIVTVQDSNNRISCYTNWENTMTAVKEDLLDDLGGYLRIRKESGHRYIDYIADFTEVCAQSIMFGENLLDFARNVDMGDIATAIIPLGAKLEEGDVEGLEKRLTIESVNNGKDCLVNQEAVNRYGFIVKTVTWDGINTPSLLKLRGEQWLSDEQFEDMVIDVKAVDLHFTDEQIEQFKLYQLVSVKSEPHGLDKHLPLYKMTLHLNNPSSNSFTLGIKKATSLTQKTNNVQNSVQKTVESLPSSSSIVQQAVDRATELINAATHGHVVTTGEEQLIMDTDDIGTAQKVWRWNLNGLGYSSNGYAGPFATAITMDGQIVGDRIVGNSITAEKIDIAYRTQVENDISDAESNAVADAGAYTDDKLKSYYTKADVETVITNTKDSIILSAKETATQLITDKLKSYYTAAEVKVLTDGVVTTATQNAQAYVDGKLGDYVQTSTFNVKVGEINSEVSSKVGNNTIISAINQTAEKIKINASQISLEGTITANGTFSIDANGTMSATSGSFKGDVKATTLEAQKAYYINDGDWSEAKKIIEIVSDNSTDNEYRFGMLESDWLADPSYIDIWTSSQYRYMDFYADGFEFYGGGGSDGNLSFTRLNLYMDMGKYLMGSDGGLIINHHSTGMYFGPSTNAAGNSPKTCIRGKEVRLYTLSGTGTGAIYLGSSGSTAITSDENLKDIYGIDDRYEHFFEALKPISYVYKNNGHRTHIGYGARAVEKALLNAGLTTEEFAGVLIDRDVTIDADEMGTEEDVHFDELYSLRMGEFIGLNTYMIQKLMKRVEALERR